MKNRISLTTILSALTIFTASFSIFSQTSTYKDRLARVRDMANSNELIMIWSQGDNQNTQKSYQRIYDLDLTQPLDSRLVTKPVNIDSTVSGNKRITVATGNFLGGKFKNIVAAWEGENNTVLLVVPEINSSTLTLSNGSRISLPGLAEFGNKKIHVETGDFLGNEQDEFVAAFQGADTTIHLQIFSFNSGSLIPQPQGSINDETSMPPNSTLNNWDIVTGDFDSDGYDDIALLFVKPEGLNWSLYAKIYTVDGNGNILPKASGEVFQRPAFSVSSLNIDGAAGSFDLDPSLEIAFGFCFATDNINEPDTYVSIIDVKNNLNTVIPSDSIMIRRDELNESDIEPLNVAAGDLNHDYRDEIILMVGNNFYVYASDDQLIPQFKLQGSVSITGDNESSDAFLAVGDMDLDQNLEIVVAKSFVDNSVGGMQHFELNVFSVDSTLSSSNQKARRQNDEPILSSAGQRNYAIALGDFDGDRIRLGVPVHYTRRGVIKPTVILYAPPVHFDIFDSTIEDLSGCYPDQSCGFWSTYIQSTTIDTTITTEVHEDWGVDLSYYIQTPGWSFRTKATYGENFSYRGSSSKSYTITTGRTAAGDDWIYANVYDIDFYEYPIYDGLNETPVGHYLVSIPGTPRPLWIEGKDDAVIGNLFRPDHEVGNVLSYSTSSAFDTSRTIVNFDEQTIGNTGTSLVSLQLSTFQENSVESSWDAGLEVGVTLGSIGSVGVSAVFVSASFPVGIEVGVTGSYNYGEISTQTVKVGQSLEVSSDLGHLQSQYGSSGTYYVQPYAYWTSYGALALDYKVSTLPGGNSFWQTRYGGKTDLAFSLPWRYDPAKNIPFPGNDATYRERTRDIILSKSEPVSGDTVTIGARIRNFGLQAVNTPFVVRFYNGNPNSGGLLIAESNIDTTINARSHINIAVQWIIPVSLSLDSVRIYVVIDPDNAVSNEVHEDNNTGWAPVIALGTITGVESEIQVPEKFLLYQSYPNPFNPTTNIAYELPHPAKVSLKVFNVLGQEVKTLVDEFKYGGKYNVQFNATGLASGIYFYRLQIEDYINTKKMVLLR
jgi:hypothetical protein